MLVFRLLFFWDYLVLYFLMVYGGCVLVPVLRLLQLFCFLFDASVISCWLQTVKMYSISKIRRYDTVTWYDFNLPSRSLKPLCKMCKYNITKHLAANLKKISWQNQNYRLVGLALLSYVFCDLEISVWKMFRGADKSLARPGRKQATDTEDFDFYICYL
jgi:hypothetical protein